MKIVRLSSIFILSLTLLFPSSSTEAEDALNHAYTYHWLARYKNSDSWDFLKSKRWFEKALEIIKNDSTIDQSNKIANIAKKGIRESDIRWENNFDNITNEYPIFPILTNTNTTYEFYDDPDVVAAVSSVENALKNFAGIIPREDMQMMTIVISEPKNPALEDELRFSINNFGNYFYRPQEEQLSVLSPQEVEISYDFPESRRSYEVLKKLANRWEKRYLTIIKLIENDIIEDVYYFGTWAYLYDSQENIIVKSIYADGFCEDRRNVPSTKLGIIIFSLLIALLVPVIIQFTYPKIFKIDKRPVFFYTSMFSLIITLVIFYPITGFFNSWAPDPVTLAILPENKFWIYSLLVCLALFPPIIVYILGTKVPGIRDRLSDGESIASLAAGTLQGNLLSMALLYSVRYSLLELEYYYFISIITIVTTSQYFGYGVSNKFHKDKNRDLIAIPIYVCAAVFLMLALLKNDHFYILLSILIGVITPFIAILSDKLSNSMFSKNSSRKGPTTEKFIKIDDSTFEHILNNPPNYTEPKMGVYVKEIIHDTITSSDIDTTQSEDSRPNVIIIKGEQGIGKTRLSYVIASMILEKFAGANDINLEHEDYESHLLYGDCDEANKDGAEIPFEPFSQAMHQILGAGRFEPPSQRANKIKSKMENLGLSDALDSTGLGLINNFLGNEPEDGEQHSATAYELGEIICKTFENLSKNLPIVFIIDDFHWIDTSSLDLFKNVLRQIVANKIKNISFILVEQSNPDSATEETDIIDSHGELDNFIKDKLIKIISISESENYFLNINRFDEFLSHSLYFDTHSAHKLKVYFEKYEITNIDMAIRTVHHLHEIEALKFNKGSVSIKKKFSLDDMEPPVDHIAQIQESMKLLDVDERLVLECSSVIGFEFNADIVSGALSRDRIETLVILRQLESKGFINDILEQDDVYQFASRSLLNGIRWIASKNIDNTNSKVSQIVREYHSRVANALEIRNNIDPSNLENVKDKDIYALASRTFAAGETLSDKAIIYNIRALNIAKKNLRYNFAIGFGKNIIKLIRETRSDNIVQNGIESLLTTIELMTYINIPPMQISDYINVTKKIVDDTSDENINKLKIKSKLLFLTADAIIHDNSNYYNKIVIEEQISIVTDFIDSSKSSLNILDKLYCRLSLERLKRKINTSDINSVLNILKEVENIKSEHDSEPYLKLKSELIEDIINLKLTDEETDESLLNLLDDCIKLKEKIEDHEGKTKLLILYGDFFIKRDEAGKAKQKFLEALDIANNIHLVDFISDANCGLGNCALLENSYEKAQQYFIDAALQAKVDDNMPNQYNAIFGILEVAKKNEDSSMIYEFSDEIQSLFRKDQSRGHKFEHLISSLNACIAFSAEAAELIRLSKDI